jgi:hypothetical protein
MQHTMNTQSHTERTHHRQQHANTCYRTHP